MIKPLFVWYNYITYDSGPCIWMSAKMKYHMEIVIRCILGINILVWCKQAIDYELMMHCLPIKVGLVLSSTDI
jgi:hypothetical protein